MSINTTGFNNHYGLDNCDRTIAKNILNDGVPNNITTNLVMIHKDSYLFNDKTAYHYDKAVVLISMNYNIETAGNFNKNARDQNSMADIKYSNVTLVISADGDVYNNLVKAVNEGTTFSPDATSEGIIVCMLVRVGGDTDKLKIGMETHFKGVKFTYVEHNPSTGLILATMQFYEAVIKNITYDNKGLPKGVNVVNVKAYDNSPGSI
jgi:hypothetical protein